MGGRPVGGAHEGRVGQVAGWQPQGAVGLLWRAPPIGTAAVRRWLLLLQGDVGLVDGQPGPPTDVDTRSQGPGPMATNDWFSPGQDAAATAR